ncbi:bestrophin-4 [Elephas maximus indicus]|uniref:bestrophin-4 n=1 Tax=Elephas maximus indicus TaxID=99487 RepID=UPI002116739F|nr:bestrophin-4 [Elephas maximus indicus]
MTVSYTLKVAEARFGGFSALLLRWRGSIYKLLYKEFLLFVALYALLSITYRLLLTQEQRQVYAQVAQYCNRSADLIPLSFVLGFYVTMVVNRWWAQYTSIPLPDQLMCVISASVHGVDQRGRLLRRTLIRYANLASVLVLRSVSTRVRKRFPTMDHVVDAGFMSQEERKKFESLKSDFNKYWVPCVWFTNLAAQARKDGRIHDDIALCLLLEELNKYRAKCSMLFHYDWISIPLVYTQVVTIAVYSFFALSLIGRQFVEREAGAAEPQEPGQEPAPALGDLDMYVPLTTLLQFFFYAGWLKVAEQIINPFGEDDDDFETNQLIDRNLQVSLLSVDDMYQNLPPAEKDPYWDEDLAQPPYTVATAAEILRPSFLGSTFNLRMSDDPEQSLQVEASPGLGRRPGAQTPLLGRFLGAGAPSPAISLRNFGRPRGPPRTPHVLRFRVEEGGDPEAADRIEEETAESADKALEP